jgi:DNA-binding transcriptional ArsR family regulator
MGRSAVSGRGRQTGTDKGASATRRACERVRVQPAVGETGTGQHALRPVSLRCYAFCVISYALCVNQPCWRPSSRTVRGDVLAATLTQPKKWWYLSELAQFLGTSPSSLQRELKALVDGGILETRRKGTRAYFKADTRSPVFAELRGLINKTAGVIPTLRTSLRLFEHGSPPRSSTARWLAAKSTRRATLTCWL